MADIVITEFMDEAVVAALAEDYAVTYDPELVHRPDALAGCLGETRALIVRSHTQVRPPLLDVAPKLVVVGRLGVGLDNIDLDACAARGIEVCPATGANAVAVAEYVIAGILMLRRGAYHATNQVRAGAWPRLDLIGGEVSGCRLGLIGFGGIARAVAAQARALGMAVCAFDPFLPANDPAWEEQAVAPVDLEALLAESDVVSLHVPLTDETRHLIDAERLAAMRPHAVLINSARGGVVDEPALVEALRAGRLGGALLDVYESEPLPAGAGFEDVPNLILTPHIAGLTRESEKRVSEVTAAQVRRVLERDSRK